MIGSVCEYVATISEATHGSMTVDQILELPVAQGAINHSEMGASLIQDRGEGGCFCRASGRAVLMRQMEAKFVLIVLDGVERRQLLRDMAGETPRI